MPVHNKGKAKRLAVPGMDSLFVYWNQFMDS